MQPEIITANENSTIPTDKTVTPQHATILRAKEYQIVLLQDQLSQLQPKVAEVSEKLRQANQLNELLQKQLTELKADNAKLHAENTNLANSNAELQHKASWLEEQLAIIKQLFTQANNDLNVLRQTRTVRVSRAVGSTVKRFVGKEQ